VSYFFKSFYRDFHSPISTLTGIAILVMAGGRLAYAICVTAALFWIYALSAIVVFFTQIIYPKIGQKYLLIFISSFFASVFLFAVSFISPLLTMKIAFVIILIPCYCAASSMFSRLNDLEFEKVMTKVSVEAGSLSLLVIAFALIREPLGYMSLTLPGGPEGIIELFPQFEEDSFLPIRIITSSTGSLLLLGYAVALFRSIKKQRTEIGGQNE